MAHLFNSSVSRNIENIVEEVACRMVNHIHNATEQCEFVLDTDSCAYDGVFYSYIELTYCDLNHLRALNLFVLICILLVLFISIGIVADDFLCPSLLTISKTFRLPDNIAGVTFLAFGNGAPDIFSSIGGISHAKPNLIFSSLYGAGIFVTTVVTGSVLLTGQFNIMKRPIMRDIIFYIMASFLVWFFIYNRLIKLSHAISLVCFYLFYIFVIVVSRYVYIRMSQNDSSQTEFVDPNTVDVPARIDIEHDARSVRSHHDPPSRTHSILSHISNNSFQEARKRAASTDDEVVLTRFYRRGTLHTPRRSRTKSELRQHLAHHHFENTIRHISKAYENERKNGKVDDVRYKDTFHGEGPSKKRGYVDEIRFTNNFGKTKYFSQFSTLSTTSLLSSQTMVELFSETKNFMIHACPIDILDWNNYSLHKKLLELIKSIPYFIMTICIPVVDLESVNENWCRLLICVNIVCAPQIILFLLSIDMSLGEKMPLWALLLIISVVFVFVVLITSEKDKAPVYHRVFSFFGFIVSVIFIKSIANEVIEILQTFGIIFHLTDSILGLTILAWGNSLGDLISNLSMARHGYPGMAISACFGGPMLNLLMGLGVPYIVLFIDGDKGQIKVEYTKMISLLYTTLTTSLCFSLLYFITNRFKSSKIHGAVLIGIYTLYVSLAVLIEFKVI